MATEPSIFEVARATKDASALRKYSPNDLYRALPEYHFACDAISNEMERRALQWTTGEACGPEEIRFVRDIVRLVTVLGHVVWRNARGVLQTLEPEAYSLERKPGNKWKVNVEIGPKRGWQVAIMAEPPLHIEAPNMWNWPSKVVLSAPAAERLMRLYDNWDRRDLHNSRPGVFCTVSASLKPVGSSGYQWFGGGQDDEHPLGVRPNQGTFQELLERRTSAIRMLSSATDEERRMIFDRSHASSSLPNDMREHPGAESAVAHEEHVVTDGRDAKEAKVLQETPSTRFAIERLRQAILLIIGVPAQAIGESVNTERSNANTNQWEIAMRHFVATTSTYRIFIESVLKDASTTESGAHIEYAEGAPSFFIQDVLPLLKEEYAAEMLSSHYGVPKEHFDPTRLSSLQPAFGAPKPFKPSNAQQKITSASGIIRGPGGRFAGPGGDRRQKRQKLSLGE
ncbi:MAG: hypothetical protein CL678_01300 [Bdellovibrionaceae bacterium]|nr:hypothetical protein [Pseudobdellovibrionaceae bacterium]